MRFSSGIRRSNLSLCWWTTFPTQKRNSIFLQLLHWNSCWNAITKWEMCLWVFAFCVHVKGCLFPKMTLGKLILAWVFQKTNKRLPAGELCCLIFQIQTNNEKVEALFVQVNHCKIQIHKICKRAAKMRKLKCMRKLLFALFGAKMENCLQ